MITEPSHQVLFQRRKTVTVTATAILTPTTTASTIRICYSLKKKIRRHIIGNPFVCVVFSLFINNRRDESDKSHIHFNT